MIEKYGSTTYSAYFIAFHSCIWFVNNQGCFLKENRKENKILLCLPWWNFHLLHGMGTVRVTTSHWCPILWSESEAIGVLFYEVIIICFKLESRPFYACVKGHLEPTHLKSSPLFTFSTKSLSQDSPSIHLFSKIIGSRFTTVKIKLGEDSLRWFVLDSLSNKENNKTTKRTFVQESPCFKYY